MAFSKQFVKTLDELFRQRTHWLRLVLGLAKPGKPPKFNKQKIDTAIKKLQEMALDAFARNLAKTEFEKHVVKPKSWHIKGHGNDKKKNFKKWYNDKISAENCIYIFWGKDRKECLWVGKTCSGSSRPSFHFDKIWFLKAKRVTIYPVQSKSQIPKLECLAIHRFRPIYNKNRAATKKWAKTCPIHKIHRSIQIELRSIFRLR